MQMPRTSPFYNVFSAVLAFVIWGGWAFWVNQTKSFSHGIFSGLVQGTLSFFMTFVMVYVVTKLYRRFNHIYLKMILPGTITVSVSTLLLITMHSLAGTPQIFYTILPVFLVAFFFCLFTCNQLRIREQTTRGTNE